MFKALFAKMKSNPLSYVIPISVIIWISCILLGDLIYETNDDSIRNMISAGAYSAESQHLIYSNILFGFFIKSLYTLFPSINCYLWTELVLNLVGVIIISFLIEKNIDGYVPFSVNVFVSILIPSLLSYDLFLSLQYTKCALFYCIVGFSVLSNVLAHKQLILWQYITACLFILLGFCVRSLSVVVVLPFFAIASIIIFFSKRITLSKLSVCIIPLLLCLVAGYLDNSQFGPTPRIGKTTINGTKSWLKKETMEIITLIGTRMNISTPVSQKPTLN